MFPEIVTGNSHADDRGIVFYNNDFNASDVKRFYLIQNNSTEYIRAWQGHKIEQRWFSAVLGKFQIHLIKIDNWENPSKNLIKYSFVLNAEKLDVLHVPNGYISSIQSLEDGSKLLLMSNYLLGEVKDEYRFDIDYFD